jgi:class 3 adenylate cyclase
MILPRLRAEPCDNLAGEMAMAQADRLISLASSADGVRIAYADDGGDGYPLVVTPGLWSHCAQLERVTFLRRSFERLRACGVRIITYDERGKGSSERRVMDISLSSRVADLQAVVDAAGLREFGVFGFMEGVPTAIAYAHDRPDCVSRLVLFAGFADGHSDFEQSLIYRSIAAIRDLADAVWEAFTLMVANGTLTYGDTSEAGMLAEVYRASIEPEMLRRYLDQYASLDVTGLLPSVAAPTLVFGLAEPDQGIAAGIRGARLLPIAPWSDELLHPDAADELEAFLSGGRRSRAPDPYGPSGFRTILFTDLQGHTEMMARLGDAQGREVLREHERITRQCLRTHGGAEIKTMGDGFMASFGSAQKALECASALQRVVTESLVLNPHTSVRVGINAGEPIAEDNDLFGASVIVAARIAAKASGGQVLVADVVRQLVAGKGFLFSDTGEHVLKGFEEPARIWELRWEA